MKPFAYASPGSIAGAVAFGQDNGRYLGGGIDLLGELKEGLAEAKTVVNIKGLPALDQILFDKDKLLLGTNVTLTVLSEHGQVRAQLPGLAEAASEVGSPQIRNVATVGGNLAQHSRCWYYRHRDVSCLKKGGDICHAREGENKYHSLFSGNPCISPVVSNLGTMLTALGAVAIVQSGGQKKKLTLPELYARAWENPLAHHSLQPGELILGVEVPLAGAKSTYRQISEKSSFDWALVSCGASVTMKGGAVESARVVLGSVAPVPYENPAANDLLKGRKIDEAAAEGVAAALLKNATPFAHNAYKVPMARALVKRVLLSLA